MKMDRLDLSCMETLPEIYFLFRNTRKPDRKTVKILFPYFDTFGFLYPFLFMCNIGLDDFICDNFIVQINSL